MIWIVGQAWALLNLGLLGLQIASLVKITQIDLVLNPDSTPFTSVALLEHSKLLSGW